jgi:hypothetical protein
MQSCQLASPTFLRGVVPSIVFFCLDWFSKILNRVASVSVRKGKKPGGIYEGLDFGGSVTAGAQPVEGEVIVWL